MSDNEFDDNIPSELDTLKERADIMGIKYHPNIGVEKLREKVNGVLQGTEEKEEPVNEETPKPAVKAKKIIPQKSQVQLMQEYHTRLRNEARRLVRVVVVCMNPNKKDWPGEIITTGNSVVGTLKKFVPFNVEAGYHVPHMIYELLRDRKYQHFVKKKVNGKDVMESVISPEFNIRLLDPLTPQQLDELKTKQALNRSID